MSPSRRVRVTSPQTRIASGRMQRHGRRMLPVPPPADLDAARQMHARQLRIALRTLLLLAVLLGGLIGVAALFPALDQVRLFGIPASWVLIGAAPYPALLLIGALHVRAAERAEDRAEDRP